MKISISFLLTLFGLQGCKGQENKVSQGEESKVLPVEFNEYSFLNTKFESDKFEVVLLAEVDYSMGPHPIRLFYSVNNQVILEAERESENTNGGVDYFKLDNVTIGWIPNITTKWITNFRVYGTIKNLFTITKYSVMSPTSVETNGLNPGISGLSVFPVARSFTLGVQITY